MILILLDDGCHLDQSYVENKLSLPYKFKMSYVHSLFTPLEGRLGDRTVKFYIVQFQGCESVNVSFFF